MTPIEYTLIVLAVLLLFNIFLTYSKDAQQSQKIRSIATVVEQLQRDLYTFNKKIDQEMTILSETMPNEKSLHVKESIHAEMKAMSEVLEEALLSIENSFDGYKIKQDARLIKIEGHLKNLSLPSSVSGMDDEKILALYNQGTTIETIAKELRISKPEVEFVLKINQLQ